MAAIDREYLKATIQNCLTQEREGRDLAAKARGAIILAEALLARLEETDPEPPAAEPVAG